MSTDFKILQQEAEAASQDAAKLLSESNGGFARQHHSGEALDSFMEVLDKASQGDFRSRMILREAMHTGDFPYLFADTIDRSTMAAFRSIEPNWAAFTGTGTVRDFRPSKRLGIEGMQSILDEVMERAEYPERGVTEETPKTFTVAKYGARFGLSFETLINDDLSQLRDLPTRLAVSARRSEALSVTKAYCASTGYNTTLFSAGNKNIAATSLGMTTANAPLSLHALGEAMFIMNSQKDIDGFPIITEAYTLVIPPALEVTARNILGATQFVSTGLYGAYTNSSNTTVTHTNNWLSGKLNLVVDPYIPLVVTTGSIMNTAWFLFGSRSAERTALEMTYLEGYGTPDLFVKAPNANRLGGGSVPESFENDSIEYKIRHIYGVNYYEPKMAFASSGAGS